MLFSNWLRNWKRSLERRSALHHSLHRKPSGRRWAPRPGLEVLEDRLAPAVLTVDTTADSTAASNALTLREAILLVNNGGNAQAALGRNLTSGEANQISGTFGVNDTIAFDITAASDTGGGFNATTGVATITPQSALPTITNAVFIDGYSQPGASGNTNAFGLADNAQLKVELDGAEAGNGNGLTISAPSTTICGLVINRFPGAGIYAASTIDTWVYGNYIGLDPTGEASYEGNESGVYFSGVSDATVGSNGDGVNDLLERNVISGQTQYPVGGVGAIGSTDITIRGNYLGTDATGTQVISTGAEYPTGNGNSSIFGQNSTNLNILGNLVSGGSYFGILLFGDADPVIQGNRIGTNAAGTAALGGAGGAAGIWMDFGTHDALVGGRLRVPAT